MNAREVLLWAPLALAACELPNYPQYTVPFHRDAGVQDAAIGVTAPLPDGGTRDPSDPQTSSDAGMQNSADSSAPQGSWKNVTANLAGMNAGCGNLLMIVADPESELVVAGLSNASLWSLDSASASWSVLTTDVDAGAGPITGGPSNLLFDPNDPAHFWLTTIYGQNGVYETHDRGKTFQAAGTVRHVDEVSVNFGASDYLPWVAGGHEAGRTLWLSIDSGASWTDIGANLPADESCTHPLVLDAKTLLVGCSYNAEGIYRSTDLGQTWKLVSDKGGSGSAVQHPSGALLWKDGSGTVFVSADLGLTWKQAGAAGVLAPYAPGPLLLPDGRLAGVGANAVMVSSDLGASWTPVSPGLPYGDVTGFSYSAEQHAFYIKHSTCNEPAATDPVPKDAVMQYGWDYEGG